MRINDPEVVAEVKAAFARYEAGLTSNDLAILDASFWESPHTIRYGAGENLYGIDDVRAFRSARPAVGLDRQLSRTVITTFDTDFATRFDPCSPATAPRVASGASSRAGCVSRRDGAWSPRKSASSPIPAPLETSAGTTVRPTPRAPSRHRCRGLRRRAPSRGSETGCRRRLATSGLREARRETPGR